METSPAQRGSTANAHLSQILRCSWCRPAQQGGSTACDSFSHLQTNCSDDAMSFAHLSQILQHLISIIQEFVRRDKSVYPAVLLSTLRRRPSSRRAPPTPQRSCKMSRSPPSSSLVASVCRLAAAKSLHIAHFYGLLFTTAAADDTRVSLPKFFRRRGTQDSRSKSTSTPARREGTKVYLQ